MKRSFLFMLTAFTVLFFECAKKVNSDLQAQSVPGRIIHIPNPGDGNDIQPLIQAAVDTAINGDEIDIPEGSFVVNKSIVVKKFISFKGAGLKNTILYRSETVPDAILTYDTFLSIFKFNINNNVQSNIVVSDLCLKSKKPSVTTGDGGSLAADFGIKFINCLGFVVTRCRFENFGDAAISVQHYDNQASGLISKNEFYHNVKGPDGLELGYGVVIFGENAQWISDPGFGSSNFIFVEDNNFDFHRHAIAAGGCALYVFRHNTIVNNNIGPKSGQAVDAHEARETPGANFYSARAVEIYNNTIVNTTFTDGTPIVPGKSAKMLVENAILIRGGEALIHDNNIDGYRFGVGVVNFVVTGTQPYPIFDQIGYLSGLKFGDKHIGVDPGPGDGDLFIWNNNFKPYSAPDTSQDFYNYQPAYFKEGRDYHLLAKPLYRPFTYPHPLAK